MIYNRLGYYNRLDYQVENNLLLGRPMTASRYLKRLVGDLTMQIIFRHC